MPSGKLDGISAQDLVTRDAEYGAAIGNNPSASKFWQVYFHALNPSANTDVNVQVTITYYVYLRDRADITYSS